MAVDLGLVDVLCLHSVNQQEHEKKLANISFKPNIEDTHLVNYALEKIIKSELLRAANRARNFCMQKAKWSGSYVLRYQAARPALLITFSELGEVDAEYLADLVRQLRVLSGLDRQGCPQRNQPIVGDKCDESCLV